MPLTYQLGTQTGQLYYARDMSVVTARLAALGMSLYRVSSTWNYAKGSFAGLETTAGTYDSTSASAISSLVATLKAAGIEPLVLVDISGEPPGTSQPGPLLPSTWTSGPPCTPAQFADCMGWLVAQSGLQGLRWELCNEPDYEGQPHALYTQALQQAYTSMKQADPSCTVHLGPVANVNSGGSGITFLTNCYADGIKGHYDVMSFHEYAYPGDQGPDGTAGHGTMLSQLSGLKTLRANNGDATPLWLTETGWQWSGTGLSHALQAQWLAQWLQELEGQGVDAVIQYQLADGGGYWGLSEDVTYAEYQSFYEIAELQSGPRFAAAGGSRLRL